MRFVRGLKATGGRAVTKTADMLNLSPAQVETALRYYADYADEVESRIRLDEEQARRAEAAWRRRQSVLG